MTIRHGLLLVLATAALDRVGGLSSSSPPTSRRAPGPPRHLFVLVHGLAGTPSDLDYLRRRLEATGGGEEDGTVEVLSVRSNEGRTFDGIQAGAARVASEVLERVAARTVTLYNTLAPRWGIDHARAFRLPVTCPFSELFLGVKDKDYATGDDHVGRVVIDLGQVRSNTTYDAWWPLQYSALNHHVSRLGSVRVRLVPAPRGTGLVAAPASKKILAMAGLDDCYTSTTGHSRSTGNFSWAVFKALAKSHGFLTPDLWTETTFTAAPFQQHTDHLMNFKAAKSAYAEY